MRTAHRSCSPIRPGFMAGSGRRSPSDSSRAGHRVWSLDFRGHGDSDAPHVNGERLFVGRFRKRRARRDRPSRTRGRSRVARGRALQRCGRAAARRGPPARYLPAHLGVRADHVPDRATFRSVAWRPTSSRLARSARRRRNEWASIEEAYEAYSSKPPLNVMAPESLRAYVEYGLRDRGDGVFELKCAPEAEAATYSNAPTNGAWAVLPEVNAKVACRVRCRRRPTSARPSRRGSWNGFPTARSRCGPTAGTSAHSSIPTCAPTRSAASRVRR